MDAKITLSFDEKVIQKAKKYAEENNISLSRLIEVLLRKITVENYRNIEDMPISDWVHEIAEGEIEYHSKKRSKKSTRDEYYKSRK